MSRIANPRQQNEDSDCKSAPKKGNKKYDPKK